VTVHYTRDQRKAAKENGQGLITLSVYDPDVGSTTIQGPADKKTLDMTNEAITAIIKQWSE
jgi:hypothetical protein